MEALKRYTVKNVEQVFVLLILTSIVAILIGAVVGRRTSNLQTDKQFTDGQAIY